VSTGSILSEYGRGQMDGLSFANDGQETRDRLFYKIGVLTGNLASTTIAMWSADLHLEAMAANWRAVLAERLALPTAERWDLAALQRWAAAQDKAGAP